MIFFLYTAPPVGRHIFCPEYKTLFYDDPSINPESLLQYMKQCYPSGDTVQCENLGSEYIGVC